MGKVKIGSHTLELSNEDKILFPSVKITKGDLIDYYKKIGKRMMTFLKDRPISMIRYPSGIDRQGFFQKDAGDYFPKWIKTKKIKKQGGVHTNYVIVNNLATLIYLANQACISPHIWLSKTDKLNYPDRIIFDLDPSGVSFSKVRKAALLLKERVEEIGLKPFAMITGSKGIHVIIPIKRKYNFDYVRNYAKNLVKPLIEKHKKLLTLEIRKEKRKGLIFIDTIRNAFGQTTVAPYGVRAKKGASIATPVSWQEVQDSKLKPNKYNIKNIFKHLSKIEDPWKNISKSSASLPKL
ncbi:ATP-dependent DNA ligase [Candidatus Dependentiae bacterium]|nr:ATP-dependent DNA ligase [Candidatus Dependentiae bacterium]